jgi:UDP-glucose 4-epimerase
MKILIFGENSYIGNSFARFAEERFPQGMEIKKISSRKSAYEDDDFAAADCILYCAGIAHRKAPPALHFSVNCDLALVIAAKARKAGTRQFVYLSSAAVLNPVEAYGQSKLKAETGLKEMESDDFTVAVVRPPMVYGKGCKGNFNRLVKLARNVPIFPDIKNKRSMVYIENLCYFLTEIIGRRISGTFFPQNAKPVCTTELVRHIVKGLRRKVWFTPLFNWFVYLFLWVPAVGKLFTDFVYEGEESGLVDYIGLEESVKRSLNIN